MIASMIHSFSSLFFLTTTFSLLLLTFQKALKAYSADQSYTLDPIERYRDAVATSLRVNGRSTQKILHSLRNGPVSSQLKYAIKNSPQFRSLPEPFFSFTHRYHSKYDYSLVPDQFSIMGQVEYTFRNYRTSTQGYSQQQYVSCRCLTTECIDAIIVVLARVEKQSGQPSSSQGQVCLYPRIENTLRYIECHTQLLNVDVKLVNPLDRKWSYGVVSNDISWAAYGNRTALTFKVSDYQLSKMQNQSFHHDIVPRFLSLQKSTEQFYDFAFNRTSDHSFEYALETNSEDCVAIFNSALNASDWIGTQQDIMATGGMPQLFFDEMPQMGGPVSFFLAVASAIPLLGENHHLEPVDAALIAPLLIFVAMELYMRLFWYSYLAYLDATLAIDGHNPNSAAGAIYISVSLFGFIRPLFSKLRTSFFFSVVVIAFLWFLYKAVHAVLQLPRHLQWRSHDSFARDHMHPLIQSNTQGSNT